MKIARDLIDRTRFTSGWVYGLIPIILIPIVALPLLRPVWENDFFLHIQMGRDILAHHRLSGDPNWLYGPTRPNWVTTMAVPEVLMYLVYHFFGFIGFTILEVTAGLLLIPIIFSCVKYLAPKPLTVGSVKVGSIVASLIIVFYSWSILPRPQTISLLLFPIVCLWMIELATNGRAPKLIPSSLLIIVWTWFHGYSLLVAPLLILAAFCYIFGFFIVEKKSRLASSKTALIKILRQWRVFLALMIAPVVNPIGYNYWLTSIRVRTASSHLISEWQKPNLHNDAFLGILSLIGFWFAVALWHWFSIRNRGKEDLLLKMVSISIIREGLLIFTALLILAQTRRTSILLIPLVGLLLARRAMFTFSDTPERVMDRWKSKGSRRLALLTTGLLAVTILSFNGSGLGGIGAFSQEQAPLKIFSAMNNVSGEHRVLISYNISSTLIPYVHNAKVSIDGRTDKFGDSGALEYYKCIKAKLGCGEILSLYKDSTDAVLSNKDKVVDILKHRGWTVKMTVKTGSLNYLWLQAPAQ